MSQTVPAPAPFLVPCPQCHKAVVYTTTNPWRPFCSERCKQIDMGAWASESFRVPEAPPQEEPGDDAY